MVAALASVTLLASLGVAPAVFAATPFVTGDVMAAVGDGSVKQFDPTAVLKNTLVGTPSTYTAGMAFDSVGNLYVTDFGSGSVDRYDTGGTFLGAFITGLTGDPESLSFDAAGNLYVGQADGTGDVLKFNSSGAPLGSFDVATEDRGSDWIDLAADQCTLFYTSEGTLVKRFNVCTNTQLADFATLPGGPAYALRIRPNGDVIVAATSFAYRLDSTGALVQTYTVPDASLLFGMNLDPDGTSFWTGDLQTGDINRINIATGAILKTFNSSPFTVLGGLAVVGEIRVGTPTGTITVTKDLIPAGDPGKFNLKIDAAVVKADAVDGDGSGPISVNVGNHDVSETAGTGTLLVDYDSSINCTEDTNTASPVTGTGAGPVTVPVAKDDTWTCIITNTRKSVTTGSIKIVKNTTGGDGVFNFTVGGPTSATPSVTTSGGTGNTTITANAGTGYSITEASQAGWTPTSASCDNGTTANFTVTAGQTVTCTFANTKQVGGGTLSDGHLWLGLRNSDDQGTQFDVKVELIRGTAVVATGLTRCVINLTRNPAFAKDITVPWDTGSATFAPGDAVKISTRIGTNPNGTKCSGPGGSHNNAVALRFYYDHATRPSRFDATPSTLYFHSDGGGCDKPVATTDSKNVTTRYLDSTAPLGAPALVKCKDSGKLNFNNGNPYTEVGTWTLP